MVDTIVEININKVNGLVFVDLDKSVHPQRRLWLHQS